MHETYINRLNAELKEAEKNYQRCLRIIALSSINAPKTPSEKEKYAKADSECKYWKNRIKELRQELQDLNQGSFKINSIRSKSKNQILGADSQETAYIVKEYPYRGKVRTTLRIWVEHKAGLGDRVVKQTLNPFTGAWNKPKPSKYYPVVFLESRLQKDGRVFVVPIKINSITSLSQLNELKKRYQLSPAQEKHLIRLIQNQKQAG